MSIRRIGIIGLMICLPWLLLAAEDRLEKPIRFAPLPMEGRKILHEQFFGLIRYLQQAVDRPIELVDFDDYGELLQAFHDGDVDLAYLGPLPYALLAKSDEDVEPVVCFREADGQSLYTCSLVAAGGSRINLATDQGLHIGLTQPISTCGYLAVSQLLQTMGRHLDDPGIRYSYAGSHTVATLGVLQGVYDLAGVKTSVAERYRHMDLQTLAVSRPFPGLGLYANRRELDAGLVERIRQALLKIDPTNPAFDRSQVEGWGASLRNGAVAPSHCNDRELLDAIDELPPLLEATP
jgi:phosphonate transport system substrate-binding protein